MKIPFGIVKRRQLHFILNNIPYHFSQATITRSDAPAELRDKEIPTNEEFVSITLYAPHEVETGGAYACIDWHGDFLGFWEEDDKNPRAEWLIRCTSQEKP